MKKTILPGLILVMIFTAIAAYVFAQSTTSTGPGGGSVPAAGKLTAPNAQESGDAQRLVQAVNAGDARTACAILNTYGVAASTTAAMEARMGQTPERATLAEPFLKASVALTLTGYETNVQAHLQAAAALGYGRPVWISRWLETNWVTRCDAELQRCPVAPIGVLNVKLRDPNFIRFFKWYDRYAELLHSVVLNGDELTNAKLEPGYEQANLTLNALYQLIKARKPDAFVWLSVVKQDSRSDEPWLKAMTFKPDGLQISNLRQFHSPFAETRRRYLEIMGEDLPMMVSGFYGYKDAVQTKGKAVSAAKKTQNADRANGRARKVQDANEQQTAEAQAQLGGIGAVVGQDLEKQETLLQSLGYRGLSAHQLLLEAIANKGRATPVGKSDMVDARVAWLDSYYAAQDYQSMSELAAFLLSQSSPGDMNWTVGKLYEGIGLLSQSPPQTQRGAAVLDEVLAFDFKGRPGRDHYILGAAKWRIYAATITGDQARAQDVVKWVEGREFRPDLKESFLKQTRKDLTAPATQPK